MSFAYIDNKQPCLTDLLEKDLDIRKLEIYTDVAIGGYFIEFILKGYNYKIKTSIDFFNPKTQYSDILKLCDQNINSVILLNMETLSIL